MTEKKSNAWIDHVRAFQTANGCTYKQAMLDSKATYQKKVKPEKTNAKTPKTDTVVKKKTKPPVANIPVQQEDSQVQENGSDEHSALIFVGARATAKAALKLARGKTAAAARRTKKVVAKPSSDSEESESFDIDGK